MTEHTAKAIRGAARWLACGAVAVALIMTGQEQGIFFVILVLIAFD